MTPDTIIYGLAGAFVLSAATRLAIALGRNRQVMAAKRNPSPGKTTDVLIGQESGGAAAVECESLLSLSRVRRSLLRLILPLGAACAVLSILPALLDMPERNPFRLLAASIVFGGICTSISHGSSNFSVKKSPFGRLMLGWEIIAGLVLLAGAFLFRQPPAGGLDVQWPVAGEWRVITGGAYGLTNYHHDSPPSQNYAIDMVSADRANPTLGAQVIAPVNATVSKAVADCRDDQPCADEGNHVILQNADGTEIWLAHLKENSVAVRQGDSVKAGTLIGLCGTTGSAEQPHLHIHAQKDGQAVPLLFGAERKWLIRADKFVAGAVAGVSQR